MFVNSFSLLLDVNLHPKNSIIQVSRNKQLMYTHRIIYFNFSKLSLQRSTRGIWVDLVGNAINTNEGK